MLSIPSKRGLCPRERQGAEQPHDPFRPRADLSKVTEVKVAHGRDRLRADGCFDGQDGGPLCEDDADRLADFVRGTE
ncbi:hypothetical protein ACOT81_04310 [Streptomyces sp. WI04-05B]|uniref:hypothetical protein n=1 Tax=Streptomyces TaxID=1883 RepID=UPI0029A48E52|nr:MULTISPECIES: hypothetical protein [unclassified Streptomyces]MDX2547725.1 hypothetical protein [Streptomyces sp. WI04-05B]MDX2590038.1 hypothetical protein [Streptomyces sp. WI04-05A]MDX3748080.1 hypothetical protein [Streptomyces sp. AK08-02]